jgi:hypothetical protein
MSNLHVISDLDYYFTEKFFPDDLVLPDVDLVIVTGNCGVHRKTVHYVEQLCERYPNTQFVMNFGIIEIVNQKYENQLRDGLYARQLYYEHWPKNLHYKFEEPLSLTIKDKNFDILCMFGFPYIDTSVVDDKNWRNTKWYRFAYHGITHDQNMFKPKMASDVYHGWSPIWSTPELCRQDHDREKEIILAWKNARKEDSTQILVSALGPKSKEYLNNIPYTMYDGVNPNFWVTGSSESNEDYILTNAGRGSLHRSKVFVV